MKKIFTLFTAILFVGSMFADVELAYAIVFGNNVNNVAQIASTTNASTVISAGTDYVASKPFTVNSGNCYYGDTKTCIRLGKQNNASKLTISLSEAGQVKAAKIVVNAERLNSNSAGVKLNVNSIGGQEIGANAADYSYEYETATDIETIVLEADKSVKIFSISVYVEEVIPDEPSIKLTPSTFEFSSEAAADNSVAIAFRNWGEVEVFDADATLFSDEDCTAAIEAEDAWISGFEFNADFTELTFDVAANEVDEARTAYIQIYMLGEDAETESTAVIEVKQAAFSIAHDYKLTAFADIEATDEVIITMKNDANNKVYALLSSNGDTSTPDARLVTVSNNTITAEPEEEMFWNIVKGENGEFVINLAGDNTKWLYCIADSKGIRVGTEDAKNFKIDQNYIYNVAKERHLGVYISGGDWRCYAPSGSEVAGNISDETLGFYVRKMAQPTAIDNTAVEAKAVKTIVNGQLLITRDGKTFNVLGTQVR